MATRGTRKKTEKRVRKPGDALPSKFKDVMRPSDLDADVRASFFKYIHRGVPLPLACSAIGLRFEVLSDWMRKDVTDPEMLDFRREISQHDALGVVELIDTIWEAKSVLKLNAHRFLLERRVPSPGVNGKPSSVVNVNMTNSVTNVQTGGPMIEASLNVLKMAGVTVPKQLEIELVGDTE